jgi:16S rRNA (cytosine967-C5)-methyltransferase
LLRIGAAQLLVLHTPPHAVVSECVEAARRTAAAERFAGLINAVLRKVSHLRGDFDGMPPGAALPAWLFTRWRAAYGDAQAERIAAAQLQEPPLDLTLRDGDLADWAETLGGAAIGQATVRLEQRGDVRSLPGYDAGAWWVQDAAAAMVAPMLGEVRGLRVADLCAAPGGKTMQLAAAGAEVTAVDVSEARLARVRENLGRTRLHAEIVVADAIAYSPSAPFDAVLLDAPCSATGTLRRHPEAAWLRRPTDLPALAKLQADLLDAAVRMLRPGGALVYAVCSLEPEEGPQAVTAALMRHGDQLAVEGAPLRTMPADGMDGFFAQKLLVR